MNETIETMLAHRSIRRFETTPIPDAHIESCVRAGQAAATSSAVQAYSVIRVEDPEKRAAIAQLAGPQDKVARCGAFFVFCADTRRHTALCRRAGTTYEPTFEKLLVAIIDATIFAQNTTLAFESLGYGTCYIGGIRNDLPEIARLLSIPSGVFPLFGLCAGVKAQDPVARPRLPIGGILHNDAYPNDDELLRAVDEYDAVYTAYLEDRGAEPSPWSTTMAYKLTQRTREDVGSFFADRGAHMG